MPSRESNDHPNASSAGLQGLRVLVVEDGWQVANALKISLECMGLVVVGPVATTAEAEQLAGECSPELAVVDVNLKGEMAYALMDRLRERGTRIIVISGYSHLPESLKEFAAILHKPFTASALLAALRQVWERDRAP